MTLKVEAASRKDAITAKYGVTMEHRHFSKVAEIIKLYAVGREQHTELAEFFAAELANTNPRFDRARFLRACGV